MQFELVRAVPDDADLVVEGVTARRRAEDPTVAAAGFEGKEGQSVLLPVGCSSGSGSATRQATTRCAEPRRSRHARRDALQRTSPRRCRRRQAVAEGFALGAYQFRIPVEADAEPHRAGVGRGRRRRAGAAALAARCARRGGGRPRPRPRERTRRPLTAAGVRRPTARSPTQAGLKVKVLDEKAIAKARLGGLLGVNRGSRQPARFVELTYEPADARPKATVALVGKGITFDSGGLSIKTAEGMIGMKGDMGGAAAVLGAMSAASDLGVKVARAGFLPLTDNMLGGDANASATCSRTATARPSRCSTPTPRAG